MDSEEELAVRLDEDEAAAKKAASVAGPDWHYSRAVTANGAPALIVAGDDDEIDVADTLHRDDEEIAPHIARNDPARTLRYVEAGRDIIRESRGEGHGWAEHEPAYYAGLDFAVRRLGEVYDEALSCDGASR